MTKQQADHILALSASPHWAALMSYKKERLEALQIEFEWESANVPKIRGQILELRADLTLQAKALEMLEGSE